MIRRPLVALLFALMLLLSGCFTTALWGGGIEASEEFNTETGEIETGYGPSMDFSNVRSWADLGACILLTPVTVVLDIVTSPVQAFLFGWDDDEEDCEERSARPVGGGRVGVTAMQRTGASGRIDREVLDGAAPTTHCPKTRPTELLLEWRARESRARSPDSDVKLDLGRGWIGGLQPLGRS